MRVREALEILWESGDAVAVAKPAGLATIPGRAESISILECLGSQLNLAASGKADPRVRVVHRLDKETSGVLLFAKNIHAQRHLSQQFHDNTVSKEYLALVSGRPNEDHGEIDAPLARHPTSPKRMAIVRHGGRPARTVWKMEESFRDYSLLRVFPKTGKTHQIRVHMASIGLPLAVDFLYHPPPIDRPPGVFLSGFKADYRPTRGEAERPLIDRLTLHARMLTFTDLSGQAIHVECPLPKDFRATLNQLRRHGR